MEDIEESQKYLRLSRISKWLQWLAGVYITLAILMLAGMALTLSFSSSLAERSSLELLKIWVKGSDLELQNLAHAHGFLLAGIWSFKIFIIFVMQLLIASRWYLLFRNFKNLNVFSSANISLLRQVAKLLLINAAIALVMMPAIQFVFLRMNDLHGHPNAESFTNALEDLPIIGVIFLAAWILSIGQDMITDRQLTV